MATVIILNGAGSSGKSSIARAMQEISSRVLLHVQMDAFIDMLPAALQEAPQGFSYDTVETGGRPSVAIRTGPAGARCLDGMRHAVAAMASRGNDLIVDDVILDDGINEYRRLLAPFRLRTVGVVAALDVLEARESQRGDRTIGLARWQFDRVHRGIDYDLTVDTANAAPLDCAGAILDRFDLPRKPTP